MAKQKKVRVDFLLQERLQPNEFGCYPIYLQLFYNRKYADFPLRQAVFVDDLEKYRKENPEIFEFETRQLTSLVRFEEKRLGGPASVKGIAAKYSKVYPDMYMLVNQYLNNYLFRVVITQKPEHFVEIINMDNRISVFSIIAACNRLFDGFEDQIPQSLQKKLSVLKEYLQVCEIPIHFSNSGAEQVWEKRFTVMDWLSGYAKQSLQPLIDTSKLEALVKEVSDWHLDGFFDQDTND